MARRKAFTLIELLVVVAIIALLISILLPSLSRAREITKRAVCASNARGIGQSMKVYSNDNADWYPTVLFKETTQTAPQNDVTWIGNMSANMQSQVVASSGTGQPWNQVHPSRSMFLLVVDGSCTAKQFICPSAGDSEDDLRIPGPSGGGPVVAQPGINRFDFRGYPYLSYGIQFPFGARGRGNENLDARTVIMADKGPYFTAGTPVGTSLYQNTPDAAKTAATANSPTLLTGFESLTETQVLNLDTDKWRPYNSRNHTAEGQNCLYQDGHVTFEKKPIVGVNFDNIYTYQPAQITDATLKGTLVGYIPCNKYGPSTNTDSVIVP